MSDPHIIGSLSRIAEAQERTVRLLEKINDANKTKPVSCFVAVDKDGKPVGVYLDQKSVPLWEQAVEVHVK